MSYFDKANKLKAMGISAKFIPTIIGYINGDTKNIPDEALDELTEHYGIADTKQVVNKLNLDLKVS